MEHRPHIGGHVAQERRRATQTTQLESQIRALQHKNSELQTKLVGANDIEFSLRKEIEIWQMAEHISTKDLNLAELEQRIKELEEERSQHRSEMGSQARLLQRYSEETEALFKENGAIREERENLQQRYDTLSVSTTESRTLIEHLSLEVKTQLEQLGSLQGANGQLVAGLEETKVKFEDQSEKSSTLAAELEKEKRNSARLRVALSEERKAADALQVRATVAEEELVEAKEEKEITLTELTTTVALLHPIEEEVIALRERAALLEKETTGISRLKEEHADALAHADAAIEEADRLRESFDALSKRERATDQKLQDAQKKFALERGRISELEAELRDARKMNDQAETQLLNRLDRETAVGQELKERVSKLTSSLSTAESEVARLRILVAHRAKVTASARTSTMEVARSLQEANGAAHNTPRTSTSTVRREFVRKTQLAPAVHHDPAKVSPDRPRGQQDALLSVSPRTPTPSVPGH